MAELGCVLNAVPRMVPVLHFTLMGVSGQGPGVYLDS